MSRNFNKQKSGKVASMSFEAYLAPSSASAAAPPEERSMRNIRDRFLPAQHLDLWNEGRADVVVVSATAHASDPGALPGQSRISCGACARATLPASSIATKPTVSLRNSISYLIPFFSTDHTGS
jgi:hypothetical protein